MSTPPGWVLAKPLTLVPQFEPHTVEPAELIYLGDLCEIDETGKAKRLTFATVTETTPTYVAVKVGGPHVVLDGPFLFGGFK